MNIREITEDDIPALFVVRVATHENQLTQEQLTSLGITEETVKTRLQGTFKGWLCELNAQVVGFAIGDRATGELWVIVLLPQYVGQGIGSALLRRVEDWLQTNGCARLWLTTDLDPNLKAYRFYRQHGWQDDRIEKGLRYMVKDMSHNETIASGQN
jgi:GNAT superfamily N-acetyltransferase